MGNKNGYFWRWWNITTNIAKAIDAKLAEIDEPKSRILGIGMGAPGPVRFEDGSVYEAINLGWHHYPLKDVLEVETSLPAIIDNDANMAALGEMWKGAVKGQKILCASPWYRCRRRGHREWPSAPWEKWCSRRNWPSYRCD